MEGGERREQRRGEERGGTFERVCGGFFVWARWDLIHSLLRFLSGFFINALFFFYISHSVIFWKELFFWGGFSFFFFSFSIQELVFILHKVISL